jgi:hypothetical protein
MVQFKEGAFKDNSKGVNLLVFDYGNTAKNGMRGLDVQIDARQDGFKDASLLAPSKSGSLRLVDRENYVNGNRRFEHTLLYTQNQLDQFASAAGDKKATITLENGNTVDVYGIKADLTQTSRSFTGKTGDKYKAGVLVVDTTKPIEQSDFGVGPKIYENQIKRSVAIRELTSKAFDEVQAAKQSQPQTEAETQVESKSVEMDAPEM